MKPFSEINQSETAKKKLASLAKASNLDIELVTLLANYSWDYDPLGREPTGWVQKEQIDTEQFAKDKQLLFTHLGLTSEVNLNKEYLTVQIVAAHANKNPKQLKERLLIAGLEKNYAYLSEYATYHYLNNLNAEKLALLDAKDDYTDLDLVKALFRKLFRGGAIDRYNLLYCYCDLCIALPYQKQQTKTVFWIASLLQNIDRLNEAATLKDILKSCQGIVKGDKYFKQEILQALAYSGDVEVKGIEVSNLFIPEFRDELSSHFYANEWTYPLRFWNEN